MWKTMVFKDDMKDFTWLVHLCQKIFDINDSWWLHNTYILKICTKATYNLSFAYYFLPILKPDNCSMNILVALEFSKDMDNDH